MSFKHITSRDNSVFKHLKKLAENKRERNKEGKTLLDGVHLIEGYLQAFGEPELLIIPEGKSSQEAVALIQGLADVNTVMFPTLLFAELTPVASSAGILALVKPPTVEIPKQVSFALMLEDIQDPGNLGSILRTAEAAGINSVYLSKTSAELWSPKTLRGSQGAQVNLKCYQNQELLSLCDQISLPIYSLSICGNSLYDDDMPEDLILILGSEGGGINAEIISKSTKSISIPMQGSIESLNVGAAAGIFIYEYFRRYRSNIMG